jgi:hypothetical protein
MNPSRTLTLAEAFAFLGVSEKTLRNWCKAQRVPYTRVRNERGVLEYRFKAKDLESLSQGKPTPASQAPAVASAPVPLNRDEQDSPLPAAPLPAPAPKPTPPPSGADERYRSEFLALLREENAFLKAQLIERDRQLAAKERQFEKQLERLNTLTETLAALTKNILSK